MKEIPLKELETDTALSGYLCHKSGDILHHPGEVFSRVHRALLHQCGIDTVLFVEDSTEAEGLKQKLAFKMVPLDEIPVGEPVPVTLFGGAATPVLKEGELYSDAVHLKLVAEGITELSFKRDEMESELFQVYNYQQLLESDKGESLELVTDPDSLLIEKHENEEKAPEEENPVPVSLNDGQIPEDHFIHNPSKQITPAFCKQLMGQEEVLRVPKERNREPTPLRIVNERDTAEKKKFAEAYSRWASSLEAVFTQLKSNKETEFVLIENIAKDIIDHYFQDGFYCLNLLNARHPPSSEKYLFMHCVNVAVLSLATGVQSGYSLLQLRELVTGALLHDIGHQMTYRPLMVKRELDSSEQHKYDQHAVVGTAMLKNITKVPFSTLLVVTQHHEYCNGTGRIYHASAKQIHDFSRLVGVVDSYETQCRFTKATASMALTIRAAQAGALDLEYCKALLAVLSLYPVGVSLRLKSGVICRVIGTNGTAFKTPVLRSVYTMSDEHLFPLDSSETIDLKKRTDVALAEEVQHSALKSDLGKGF